MATSNAQAPAGSNSVSWKELCWTVGHFSRMAHLDALEDNLLWSQRACSLSWKSLGPTALYNGLSVYRILSKLSSCCRKTMRQFEFSIKSCVAINNWILILIFFLNRNKISATISFIYKVVLLCRTDLWLVWVRDFSDYRLFKTKRLGLLETYNSETTLVLEFKVIWF